MRIKHATAIALSGLIWFIGGMMLLSKGLNFIVASVRSEQIGSLIALLLPLSKTAEQAALFLVVIGLAVGYLKGRMVLTKSVKRVVDRIFSFPSPVRLIDVYNKSYILLILSMVGLGFIIRFLPISVDIRGVIDVAIGSALVKGSLMYFRFAIAAKKARSMDNV
jgi:hypothetical protein